MATWKELEKYIIKPAGQNSSTSAAAAHAMTLDVKRRNAERLKKQTAMAKSPAAQAAYRSGENPENLSFQDRSLLDAINKRDFGQADQGSMQEYLSRIQALVGAGTQMVNDTQKLTDAQRRATANLGGWMSNIEASAQYQGMTVDDYLAANPQLKAEQDRLFSASGLESMPTMEQLQKSVQKAEAGSKYSAQKTFQENQQKLEPYMTWLSMVREAAERNGYEGDLASYLNSQGSYWQDYLQGDTQLQEGKALYDRVQAGGSLSPELTQMHEDNLDSYQGTPSKLDSDWAEELLASGRNAEWLQLWNDEYSAKQQQYNELKELVQHANLGGADKSARETAERQLQQAEDELNQLQYVWVMGKPDYPERSQPNTALYETDSQYRAVNDPAYAQQLAYEDAYNGITPTVHHLGYLMDDRDRGMYNYLYEAQGKSVAEAYLSGIYNRLKYAYAQEEAQGMQEFATAHPILANAASVLEKVSPQRLGQTAVQVGAAVAGADLSPYDTAFQIDRTSGTIRGTTLQNIDSDIGDFLYSTGMSIADNLAAMLAGGGNATASGLFMAANGFGAQTYDVLSRGADMQDASNAGAISAVTEFFTERMGFDNILKGWMAGSVGDYSQLMTQFVKGFATGAAEETPGNFVDAMVDDWLMGDESTRQLRITELAGSMPLEDAMAQADKEFLADTVKEILAGGLAEGMMGSASYGTNAYLTGQQIQRQNLDEELMEIAQQMPEGSKSRRAADAVKRTKSKMSTATLYNALHEEMPSQSREVLDNISAAQMARQLKKDGETGDATAIAKGVLKVLRGETLTEEESQAIAQSSKGVEMMDRMSRNDERDRAEIRAYNEAYNAGYYGQEATSGMRQAYYQAGVEAAQQAEQKRLNRVGKVGLKEGGVSYIGAAMTDADVRLQNTRALDQATMARLTPQQKDAVYALRVVSKVTGIRFALYEGQADASGNITVENGKFDSATNTIFLDLNSGKNRADQGMVNYAVLRTAAHEMTHFIEKNSPEGYASLKNFIQTELTARGQDMGALVRSKQEMAERQGRMLTREAAVAEVVADACEMMLQDTQAIHRLAQKDKSLFGKIKRFLNQLMDKIRKALKDVDATHTEARALREAGKYIEGLQQLWDSALVEAVETARSVQETEAESLPVEERSETVQVLSEAVDENGDSMMSLRSMEEDYDTYRGMLKTAGASEADINALFDTIDAVMDAVRENRAKLDFGENISRESRSFFPIKPNSDPLYKVSLDFSSLCRKRLLQQAVQERLETKYDTVLTKAERVAVRQALLEVQKEGLKIEVACALCYVEAARLKSPAQIARFMDNKRANLVDYFSKASTDYATQIAAKVDQMTAELGYEVGTPMSQMKPADKKKVQAAKKAMYPAYKPTAAEEAIIRTAESLPESMYKTEKGLWQLKREHPEIFTAYTTFVRNATKSKGIEGDTPFYAGDTASISDGLIEAMNAENGTRSQSWSDFQVIHVLDYMAAIIEFSTRNAKMQTYTKVPDFVKLMGNTGMMINLSLIPTDYDGQLNFDPVEGMPYAIAQELRDIYHGSVGNISIGISDNHIIALLANGDIDYVIPYHKSSMDKKTRDAIGLKKWSDYESSQNEKQRDYPDTNRDGGRYHKAPRFSEWYNHNEAVVIAKAAQASAPAGDKTYGARMAMREMAERYKQLCHERGLQEKFPQFAQEENYWKLLIDRKMIDQVTGELIEQKAVKPVFNKADILEILSDEVARFDQVNADFEEAAARIDEMWAKGEIRKAAKSKTIVDQVSAFEDAVIVRNIAASAENTEDVQYSARENYSYDSLINKGSVTVVGIDTNTLLHRDDAVASGLANARIHADGTDRNGAPMIYVNDLGKHVIVGSKALAHGLDRRANKNGQVVARIGDVLSNSIVINEADSKTGKHTDVYVLLAAAVGSNGEPMYIRSIVRHSTMQLEDVTSFYAAHVKDENIKKRTGRVITTNGMHLHSVPPGSKFSIALLLDDVKDLYDDVLSLDVLSQFGMQRKPTTDWDGRLRFSLRETSTEELTDEYLANLNPADMDTEADRLFLQRYQTRRKAYDEIQEEYAKASEALERGRTTGFYQGDNLIRQENRVKLLKDKVDRARADLDNQLRNPGMRRLYDATAEFVRDNIQGKTSEEIAQMIADTEAEVERMSKLVDDADDSLIKAKKNLRWLKANATKKLREAQTIKELSHKSAGKVNHIKNVVRRLHSLRAQETDYKNIPEDLKAFVGDVVTLFGNNFGSTVWSHQQADRVVSLYGKLKSADGPYAEIAPFYDEDMLDTLQALSEWAKQYEQLSYGKGMTRLERAQLRFLMNEAVADLVDHVNAIVRNSRDIFNAGRKQQFAQISAEVRDELLEREDKQVLLGKAGDTLKWLDNLIRTGNITPVYFFDQLGNEALKSLFNDFRLGQEEYAFDLATAREAIQRYKEQYHYDAWKDAEELTFKTAQGHTIILTKEQALWLYATWKRERSNEIAATEHLTRGGFVYESKADPARAGKGLKKGTLNTTGHLIADSDMAVVDGYLTQEQKDYADAMVGYLSNDMAELGNRVSMEMFGIRKYKEKYYFPYQTVKDQLNQKSTAGATATTDDSRIKHSGFTHRLTAKARTAVVMGDFSEVVANHISQMVTYSNFVLPIENMNRVLNHKFETEDGSQTTIRSMIRQKYGENALKYIETFIRDMNGGARSESRSNIGRMVGLHKKAMVAASLSVALQQPSAILRAAVMMNPKYLMKAVGSKLDYEQLKRFSGVAIIKQMGRFDTNVGKSNTEWMLEADAGSLTMWQKAKQALNPMEWEQFKDRWSAITTFLPSKADEWSWAALWNAVKREQADLHKGMDTNSEEFLMLCGDRFNDIVDHTQVYDSLLAKSQIMRSSSDIDKMMTSFASEPTLTLNILYDAFANKNHPDQKKRIWSAMLYTTLSSLAAAIGSAMISAWNKDDDDRTAWEKLLNKTVDAFIGNVNPLENIPYVRDMWSMFQGYEVERTDMSLFSDLVAAVNKVKSNNYTGFRKVEELAGSIANVFGIPVKNAMRDMRRIYNAAVSDWSTPTATGITSAMMPWASSNLESYYNDAVTAYVKGDNTKAADITEYLTTVKGKDADAISSGMKKAVKDMYLAGGISREEGIKALLTAYPDSFNENDLYWDFDKWDAEKAGEIPEGESYSKYLDFYRAVETGSNLKAEIQRYLDTGVKKETLSNMISTHYKDQLIALYKTNKAETSRLQSRLLTAYTALGYDREKKLKDIKKWYE